MCCSFRKADAKVVLLGIPTKQIGKYFLEYFVNKYNLLRIIGLNLRGLKGDGSFCALKKSTKRTVPGQEPA